MRKSFCLLLLAIIIVKRSDCQQFKVSYTAAAFSQPFTGKVILYLNKEDQNPKDAMADLSAFPCFSVDAHDVKPGGAVVFDDKANAFPIKLSDIERGDYFVQAVWDRDLGGRAIGESPGNIFSQPMKVSLTKDFKASFTLVCDQVIPQPTFTDTKFVKELKVPSSLLSQSQGRPITVDAAVMLPKEYYSQP